MSRNDYNSIIVLGRTYFLTVETFLRLLAI